MSKVTQPYSFFETRRKSALLIAIILVLVLFARFAFVMIYRGGDFNPSGQMTSWPRIALNLASGDGYVYDSEAPTARRGPIPVLFLASLFSLFGPRAFPVPIVLSQWLWDAASALLIYFIAMELFSMRRVAFLAMILFGLHPVIIENSVRVNVEPLATFLLLAFVLTFLRAVRSPGWVRFIWPGIFLGLSILSLASLQFFPVLAAGLIIATLRDERQRALVAITTFCLSLIVVWSPWVIRNYLALGAFIPASTLGGHNLLKNHQTLGEVDYLRFRGAEEDEAIKKSLFAAKGIDLGLISEVEQDKLFRETALDFIRTYPGRYVILSVIRFFRLWFNQGLGLGPNVLSYAATAVNGPLILLALIACLRFPSVWTKRALPSLALLAYGTTLYMATAAELRYSIPFTPLVIILSAYALVSIVTPTVSGSKLKTDNVEGPLARLGIGTLFLIWGFPQGSHRSQFMAQELGMDVKHVYLTPKQGILYALLKYPVQAIKTLVVLAQRRPQVVFVQNPPIFAALMVYLGGLITSTKYIIDSHTDALLASWWAWSFPLHRFLSRRAIATLVTNEHLREMVAAWGANAVILEDPPATLSRRQRVHLNDVPFNVAVVSTVSYDEPILQVLEAARNLPEVSFYITGDYRTRAQHIIQSAPANVHFTGYMPDGEFYGLLQAAQAVMCLTTENHTIQSGANEALWLGKPIITSDWPLLREYFNRGTLHVDNTSDDIRRAVITMRDNLPAFEAGILALQAERRNEWHQKAEVLIRQIQQAVSSRELIL